MERLASAASAPSRRRQRLRSLLRFAATVVAVSGALLLADVALTLLWQEPISAFLTQQEQGDLAGRLHVTPAQAAEPQAPLGPQQAAAGAATFAGQVRTGDPIGRIDLPTLGRSYVAVQGTDEETLRKGPGHYPQTPFPGQGGTVAVAGHRTTYLAPFRTINELQPGQPIVMAMPYGRFTYSVEKIQIVDPDAIWVINPVGYERLVLSACNPPYSAAERIIVFARLTQVTH